MDILTHAKSTSSLRDELGRISSYHGSSPKSYLSPSVRYGIGFEVEKSSGKNTISAEAFQKWGWGVESDSSLPSAGYEAVSPAYKMTDRAQIARDLRDLAPAFDAHGNDDCCGGHISVSDLQRLPIQIVEDIAGYLPLLYALYPKRSKNDFSRALKKERYNSGRNALACRGTSRGDRLEIRIFPGVPSSEALLARYELCRYMVTHTRKSPLSLLKTAINPTTNLNTIIKKLMAVETDEHTPKDMDKLIEDIVAMDYEVDRTIFTAKQHEEMKALGINLKGLPKMTAKQKKAITDKALKHVKALDEIFGGNLCKSLGFDTPAEFLKLLQDVLEA